MLTEMDGLEDLKWVVVIGATNRPDIIDVALLRPGRFDRILEVPLPDKEARKEILMIHTKQKPLDHTVNIDRLVELTEGYTGADIAAITNAAAMSAIKEYIVDSKDKKGQDTTSPIPMGINEEGQGGKNDEKDKEGKKPGLKISMRHFETAVHKIKRKTNAISNPSLI
jgi:transitional endoplasmic reticulum ATPase